MVAFLSFWLVGWAAGEVFAIGTLLNLLPPHQRAPPTVLLGLWLVLWTVGGVGAIGALLQQVFGREELEWSSERLTVRRRFREDVALGRDDLDDVVLIGRDRTLAARTRTRTLPLVTLGTRHERTALRDELRRSLDLGHRVVATVPAGWSEVRDPTGRLVLEASRAPALVGGVVSWLLSALPAREAIRAEAPVEAALWTLVVVLALAVGLAALLWRRELLMAPGRLTLRTSGLRSSVVTIALEGLAVRLETDSDDDEWVSLVAFGKDRELEILRRQDEAEPALVLGRRLAAETGAPLAIAPELEARLGMARPTVTFDP
ncbi:MAG: hypothetical protein JNJ54_05345 [Myxococcaceae bacterium]|nr:hypothetical protein [Myxococcaceae bacterium]